MHLGARGSSTRHLGLLRSSHLPITAALPVHGVANPVEGTVMKRAGDTNEGIVARLEDLGPTRLGALLRAVREQRMQSRRDVAKRVGASTRMLRHYERGDEPVPGNVLGLLADYYGADLSARFEARVPRTTIRTRAAPNPTPGLSRHGTPTCAGNRRPNRRIWAPRRFSPILHSLAWARCCRAPARNDRTAGAMSRAR